MTRVAVYAIARNEAMHVERWVESARGADSLVVCDTGSTDGTPELLRSLGVTVHEIGVAPWRFDVARNASLALLPEVDYCIALDMDEVLLPGWREGIEEAAELGWTRPRYRYVWSWERPGVPGLVYLGDKIHARRGYRWVHPVHEVLRPCGITETGGEIGMEIHHHPDPSKSRGSYLPLLQMAVEEDPADDRNAHYYARELMYAGRHAEAAAEFRRHLALPTARWGPERAASMRYLARCEPGHAREWLAQATAAAPDTREPWVDLAEHCYRNEAWRECYAAALAALTVPSPALTYLVEGRAWGALPHDLAALAAHHLGRSDEAVEHGQRACILDPTDERLAANLAFYLAAPTTPPPGDAP